MSLKNKIKCFFGYHDFIAIAWFSEEVQKIRCQKCKTYFIINSNFKSIHTWDKDFEQMVKYCYPDHEYHFRGQQFGNSNIKEK